ncbi:MAG: cysteine hydrolase family protein, partial [Kiloniellales bacterium]|nr:cysteine hydrolase family protein [Kiloniellales bacterium]
VIVDLQKAFDDPRYRPRNNPEAEANIARLLAAWRETGRPVIHVQHLSREADSPYRPGRPGCDVKDGVRPPAGELVIQKSTNSAFVDTGLGPYLEDKGIRTLVITGVATNNCVEATARMAGNLGYETYVVADATATADRADLVGRVWRAEEIQALTLANLQGEYATVATTEEILARLVAPRATA